MKAKEIILNRPNFLASEVSLVTKTYMVDSDNAQVSTEGDRKVIKAGTIYPSNTASAIGIVFQDIDVTDGDALAPIMVAGHYYEDKLNGSIASETKTTFAGRGLFAMQEPDVTRPY